MFSELVFLQYLSLSWNQLTHLLPQSLEFRTLLSCTVHLEDNNIATVAVNAISGKYVTYVTLLEYKSACRVLISDAKVFKNQQS